MKKILKKICLMLFVLCSLFSIFTVSSLDRIEAVSSETIKESINIESTVREDNIIKFKPKDTVNKYAFATYEIVYLVDNVKYSDLVVDANISMTNDNVYYFEVSDSVIGVKIWKLKYFVSTDNFKNKMTTGNNHVGDVDSVYKKNYVEVTTDLLEELGGCDGDLSIFEECYSFKSYVFYFNLDTKIERILDLKLEYSIQYNKKTWWGLSNENYTRSFETNLDVSTQVIDLKAYEEYLIEWVELYYNPDDSNSMTLYSEFLEVEEYARNTFKRDVLGLNTNGNGYDWYVQLLLDDLLQEKDYILGSGYLRQDVQEVAIVKMSYISEGEYFLDVPVLDEDTGIVNYYTSSNMLDKIGEFIITLIDALKNNNLRWYHWLLIAVAIIIMIRFIGWLLGLVGLDKKSRIRRANERLDSLDLKDRKRDRKNRILEQKRENKLKKNSYNVKSSNYYSNNKIN